MAGTKATYNQLDLLGGLYEREERETKLTRLILTELTNLKYVHAQVGSSALEPQLKSQLQEAIDFTLWTLVNDLCKKFGSAKKAGKYAATDWAEHLAHHRVSSADCPSAETISGYFQNSESRLRGYLMGFKEILPAGSDIKTLLRYLRYANNLLL